MTNIERATRVLKRVEPHKFSHIGVENGKLITFQKVYYDGDPMPISEFDIDTDWKVIVKDFQRMMDWLHRMCWTDEGKDIY